MFSRQDENASGSATKPVGLDPRELALPPSRYRPCLDGLRAIAVYFVVFFHAAAEPLPGGFIGVDVFFVLSGYLVTQLLLRDAAEHGSVRFGRFYARRFRRLLPAAFVTLVCTAAVFAATAAPPEIIDAIPSFKAAFLYSANWYFVYQSSSYFGVDPATNPVMHFWSLAVEEQFYLLWPLCLGALFTLARRQSGRDLMIVRTVVTVAALASLAWTLWLTVVAPERAYYGTDARAYQLLAGALIALTPALVTSAARFRRSTHVAAGASIMALLAVASPLLDVNAIFRGALATLATCTLIVALEGGKGGIIDRLLASGPMVYLGKISYGTYLWHWPVLSIAARTSQLGSLSTVLVAIVFGSALASLSAALLELPIRESRLLDRHWQSVIVGGLATTILAGLVIIPIVMTPGDTVLSATESVTAVGTTLKPRDLDWRNARWSFDGTFTNCMNQPVAQCTVVEGTGRHIFLMGDSHAVAWIPTFKKIARRENLTLSVSVRGACPWQRLLFRPKTVFGRVTAYPEDCKRFKDDVYDRVIPRLNPDVIVVAQFPYDDPAQRFGFIGPDFTPLRNDSGPAVLEKATAYSLAALRSGHRDVVIIEPIPLAPKGGRDPLNCISASSTLEPCRYVVSTQPLPLENIYRALAKRERRVFSVDFDHLVCPYLPICDPVVNGQIVKWDRQHLTIKFAESLADPVDEYLKMAGLLPKRQKRAPDAPSPDVTPER